MNFVKFCELLEAHPWLPHAVGIHDYILHTVKEGEFDVDTIGFALGYHARQTVYIAFRPFEKLDLDGRGVREIGNSVLEIKTRRFKIYWEAPKVNEEWPDFELGCEVLEPPQQTTPGTYTSDLAIGQTIDELRRQKLGLTVRRVVCEYNVFAVKPKSGGLPGADHDASGNRCCYEIWEFPDEKETAR